MSCVDNGHHGIEVCVVCGKRFKSLTEEEMVSFHADNANELLISWKFDPTREIIVRQNPDRDTMTLIQEPLDGIDGAPEDGDRTS